MVRRGIRHIRHNAVAYVALFFALSGAAYATTLAPANSVNSAAIIDGQVTTPDLAANAIRADEYCLFGSCAGSKELGANAVGTSELASGAVSSAKLATGAVTSAKLAAGSVGNGQLAAGAVTGDKVKDGSLSAADIAGGIPHSDAYISRNDAPVQIGGIGDGAGVVALDLPAGYYTLTGEASLVANDQDPESAECTLSTGATTRIAMPGTGNGNGQSVTVEDLLTLTSPGTAILRCHVYPFGGLAEYSKLIAVKVAALHG